MIVRLAQERRGRPITNHGYGAARRRALALYRRDCKKAAAKGLPKPPINAYQIKGYPHIPLKPQGLNSRLRGLSVNLKARREMEKRKRDRAALLKAAAIMEMRLRP